MPSDAIDLGTMAVLVGTVALGLEKVRMDGDALTEQVKNLQARISLSITEFDVKISERDPITREMKIAPLCKNRQFHYLLSVTRHPERKNYPFILRCAYRCRPSYWSAVLLNLMRTAWHVYVLFALTVLSVSCFLLQKAGMIYSFNHVGPLFGITMWGLQDVCLYWIYVTTIILTLIFAVIAHALVTVEPRCNRYIAKLKQMKKDLDTLAKNKMMQELATYSGSNIPPKTRDLRDTFR